MISIVRGEGSRGACALGLLMMSCLIPTGSDLAAQPPDRRAGGAVVQLLGPGPTMRGELLAAAPDGIWIRVENPDPVFVPLGEVREVRVRRHNWPARRIMIWTGIAGGLTTAGMFAACTSYEGNGSGTCPGFALGWALTWAAVGGISAALVSPGWERVSPRDQGGLSPWARFPQGLPEGFPPESRNRTEPPGGEPPSDRQPAPLPE